MSRFIHPIHARGVRSTNFSIRGGKLLTDRKILKYIKEGLYGPDKQALALGQKVPRKKNAPMSAMELLRKVRAKLGMDNPL